MEETMSILEVHDVSIRYMTGDFKDIGLKEYVTVSYTHLTLPPTPYV